MLEIPGERPKPPAIISIEPVAFNATSETPDDPMITASMESATDHIPRIYSETGTPAETDGQQHEKRLLDEAYFYADNRLDDLAHALKHYPAGYASDRVADVVEDAISLPNYIPLRLEVLSTLSSRPDGEQAWLGALESAQSGVKMEQYGEQVHGLEYLAGQQADPARLFAIAESAHLIDDEVTRARVQRAAIARLAEHGPADELMVLLADIGKKPTNTTRAEIDEAVLAIAERHLVDRGGKLRFPPYCPTDSAVHPLNIWGRVKLAKHQPEQQAHEELENISSKLDAHWTDFNVRQRISVVRDIAQTPGQMNRAANLAMKIATPGYNTPAEQRAGIDTLLEIITAQEQTDPEAAQIMLSDAQARLWGVVRNAIPDDVSQKYPDKASQKQYYDPVIDNIDRLNSHKSLMVIVPGNPRLYAAATYRIHGVESSAARSAHQARAAIRAASFGLTEASERFLGNIRIDYDNNIQAVNARSLMSRTCATVAAALRTRRLANSNTR